ncbi:MAG: uL14 family ribosomal protein [Chlamydiia bacterium]|nr:uL14 family ribosomal protein [Chlamydiia bacterium]
MIKSGTQLRISDNTGALVANCIAVRKESTGKPGSLLKISVRKVDTKSNVKKKSKHLAVVVRTKGKHLRVDGTYVSFNENACVLVGDNGEPKGTSVFGPVMKEVKGKGFIKVCQQADEVI